MYKALNFSKTASSKLQNKINLSIIFNYLRKMGPMSRAEISRELDISAPAVSRVIEKLIKEGYVVETDKAKTKTGKRPTLVKINEKKGLVIGVDLARERIRAIVCNFNNKILKKYWGSKVTDNEDIAEKLVKDIGKILEDCNQDSLKGICIGLPGAIDANSGKIISAPLYGSWQKINLKDYIKKKFNVPVYTENNVNLAALAEKNYGEGKKHNDIFFVEVGNGIGSGIIIDNHLIRGNFGAAGEIGLSIINDKNLGFKIKNKGFLEKFASVKSLEKEALKAIENKKKTKILDLIDNDTAKLNPRIVCEAAVEGDATAKEIIDKMVRFLAVSIANSIFILNPEIVVIGGDIINLSGVKRLFLEPLIRLLKKTIPYMVPIVKFSSLGEDAGVIGASFMAIEALLVGEFPYKIEQEIIN